MTKERRTRRRAVAKMKSVLRRAAASTFVLLWYLHLWERIRPLLRDILLSAALEWLRRFWCCGVEGWRHEARRVWDDLVGEPIRLVLQCSGGGDDDKLLWHHSGRQRQERKTEEMTRSEGSSSSSDITTTTNTNNTNIILPPPLPPAQGLVLAMCRATVYTVSYGPWSSTVKMATVKMASTLGYVISDLGTEMRMQAEAVGDGANGGLPFHLLLPLVLVVAFWLVSHTLYMWLILGGMHNFFSHEGGGAYKRGQRVHHERPPPIKLTPLRRLRRLLWAVASCLVGQMGPLWWASIHRRHHRYCDGPQDPHSPLQRGFLGAHLGWIVDPANFAVRDEELRDDLLAQDRHPWDLLIVELFCLHLDQWLTERVVNTASFQLLRILPASVLLIRVGSRRLPLRLRLAALGAVSLGKFTAWHSVWLVNSWNHHPKGGGKVGMGGGDCCLARNLPGMAWFAVLSLGESRRHGHHHKVYPPPPSEKVA